MCAYAYITSELVLALTFVTKNQKLPLSIGIMFAFLSMDPQLHGLTLAWRQHMFWASSWIVPVRVKPYKKCGSNTASHASTVLTRKIMLNALKYYRP